jgi:hypothetical protein
VVRRRRRFTYLAAGRRWRKTTLAMTVAGEAAITGDAILWGAPTFGQCEIGWRELQRACAGAARFARNRMEVTYPSGGSVTFRSLDDPDNARGLTANGVVLDEAPLIQERAWYEVIRPVISDTDGWALLMGTPKGKNFFWRESVQAKHRPDSVAFQAPTLGVRKGLHGGLERVPHPLENPFFKFEEAQLLADTMTEQTFQQEFLAQFVDSGGGVFRRITDAPLCKLQPRGQPGHVYVMGVDWGKYNDFTVLVILDLTTTHTTPHVVIGSPWDKREMPVMEVCYLDRFNQVDYTVQMGRLLAAVEKFRPHLIVAERNAAGEPLIEVMQRMNLPVWPFVTGNASKALAIDALALALERGQLALPMETPLGEVLVNELMAYDAERLPSGALRYSAPEGMHDDATMALAMAMWGAATTGQRQAQKVMWE